MMEHACRFSQDLIHDWADQTPDTEPAIERPCVAESGRILVVDDEPIIREAVAEYLTAHGFHCVSAGSGQQALEELEQKPFDLLITDISMPGVTGLDLLRFVEKKLPTMAVIVITAFFELGNLVDSSRFAAFDYIGKPFDLEVALDRVKEILARTNQTAEAH